MSWKKIAVATLVLFAACNKPEPTVYKSNTEKDFRIEKTLLFGVNEDVLAFYEDKQFAVVWKDRLNRSALISAIIDSQYDGVLAEKYPLKELISAHFSYEMLNATQVKKADLAFTSNFFRIAQQLSHGKVNPKKMYGDWEPYLADIDYQKVLENALGEKKIYNALDELKPKSTLYAAYKKAFEKYVPVVSKDTTSEEGLLRKKIWVNLERSKWLPNDLGKQYVWINLPEYRLQVFQNNEIVAQHKVIIGKKERRTPRLSSSFNGIIINPTWTIPPTILKNDVVPKASANRGYFASNRLTIFDRKSGKKVAPENWIPENFKGYRYVQDPGKLNSLGQIKFDFPNGHMVYLHDTNHRSLFGQTVRALSSGCVRVEHPFDLAETIFKMEDIAVSRVEIDTLIAREKTKRIKLDQNVNVHQVYFTAVINADGSVKLLNDVYALDNSLYRRLVR